MKFEKTQVMNFEGAFRGMRNPLESWKKSDSMMGITDYNFIDNPQDTVVERWIDSNENYDRQYDEIREWLNKNGVINYDNGYAEYAFIGPADLKLAQKLIAGGSEHRKFLRQIMVCVDITAPLLWWKEADTYKVGTTANSTSTMHKLMAKPITLESFEIDDFDSNISTDFIEKQLIPYLEGLRLEYKKYIERAKATEVIEEKKFLTERAKKTWKELVRWLPEAWLQTRTVTMNYENLLTMCHQRQGHKLTEWHQFIKWVKTLPYANELILIN